MWNSKRNLSFKLWQLPSTVIKIIQQIGSNEPTGNEPIEVTQWKSGIILKFLYLF